MFSPDPDATNTYLEDIDAVSPNDAWAVGSTAINLDTEPLLKWWDGRWWRNKPYNTEGNGYRALYAVDAVTSDVWAVGEANGGSMAIHWDGHALSTDSPPEWELHNPNYLMDVSVISPDSVWAVGGTNTSGGGGDDGEHPIVAYRDENGWVIDALWSQFGRFEAVSGTSPSDIWAAGFWYDRIGNYPLIDHWNGSRWTVSLAPRVWGYVWDIVAIAPDDVWAIGGVTFHWDGSLWSRVMDPAEGDLFAAAAVSPSDIWAVGSFENQPFTQHWDGTQWAVVPTPAAEGTARLKGVTALPSGRLLTAGDNFQQSMIAHLEEC